MWKLIIATPLTVLLSGCNGDTESISGKNYGVECIGGVEYWYRALGNRGYMAPRIDSETLNCIRCD